MKLSNVSNFKQLSNFNFDCLQSLTYAVMITVAAVHWLRALTHSLVASVPVILVTPVMDSPAQVRPY